MATKLKSADIVIVGLGWTGGILAKELADTGLSIVVLERGAPRDTNPDFMYPIIHDELRYAQRHQLMQDVSRETRNHPRRPRHSLANVPPANVSVDYAHEMGISIVSKPASETKTETIGGAR
jgi:choline dehydrogenase-like flavoprotein